MTGLFHKSKGNILIPMISAWLARCGIRNGTLVFLRQCPPCLFQELLPEYVSAIQSLRQLLFEPQSRFLSAFYWCFHFVHGNKVRTFCSPSMLRALCNNVTKWGFHVLYPRISKNHISTNMINTNCRNSTLQFSAWFSHSWFPSPVLNGTVPDFSEVHSTSRCQAITGRQCCCPAANVCGPCAERSLQHIFGAAPQRRYGDGYGWIWAGMVPKNQTRFFF